MVESARRWRRRTGCPRAGSLRDPGGDPAADPRRRRRGAGGRGHPRRRRTGHLAALRHLRLQRLAADRRRLPGGWTTRPRTTPSRSCRSPWPAPACTSPTARPTSCRSATPSQVPAAWRLHAGLVGRALERGFYQGWDLHPGQLPTRYLATYAFYREGSLGPPRRLATTSATPGPGSSTSPPPPARWPATCIGARLRRRRGVELQPAPISTPRSWRRWPVPIPTPKTSDTTTRHPSPNIDPEGVHNDEHLLRPPRRTPRPDRAAHRSGHVHRVLRGAARAARCATSSPASAVLGPTRGSG